MRDRFMKILGVALCLGGFFPAAMTWAAGKNRPSYQPEPVETPAPVGKKAVAVVPLSPVEIELPGEGAFDFGPDFIAEIRYRLANQGNHLVVDGPRAGLLMQGPDYEWPGSVVPSAVIKYQVKALNFSAGARGARVFYGFDERFSAPASWKNEFPGIGSSRAEEIFGTSFANEGMSPFDSRSGLDVGEGFAVDFLVGGFGWQFRQFQAELRLDLEIHSNFSGKSEFRKVAVEGSGFFFELDGSYHGYSGGIELARADALRSAVKKALKASAEVIERNLQGLPLMARVDGVTPDGDFLLGTGFEAEIPSGTEYFIRDPGVQDSEVFPVLKVSRSVASGAIARLVQNSASNADFRAWIGKRVVENRPEFRKAAVQYARKQASFRLGANGEGASWRQESIHLPDEVFNTHGNSWFSNLFSSSLVQTLFLPYRIWRYFQYDQAYGQEADSGPGGIRNAWEWSERQLARPWARQLGLTRLDPSDLKREPPIVAVIDSGIDYNHPALHDNLWLNPAPVEDFKGRKDRYGWDFVSNDSRPYDDSYHGTEVASIVTAIAPWARIMALKAFSPYGTTTSAALYASMVYAVDHGAELILCAWNSSIPSEAFREGEEYARQRGVLVISPATIHDESWKLPMPQGPFEVALPRGGGELRSSPDFQAAYLAGVLARVSGKNPI